MPSIDFEQFLQHHLNEMFSFAYRLCGNRESAEDLVQDLFVNISQKEIDAAHIKNPRAWLATALYRMFVDQWRHEKRSPVFSGYTSNNDSNEHNPIETAISNDPSPDEHIQLNQAQDRITTALNGLNDIHKHVLIMHDMHDYTLLEIEKITGIPVGTLKSRLHRARETLQKTLHNLEPILPFRRSNTRSKVK